MISFLFSVISSLVISFLVVVFAFAVNSAITENIFGLEGLVLAPLIWGLSFPAYFLAFGFAFKKHRSFLSFIISLLSITILTLASAFYPILIIFASWIGLFLGIFLFKKITDFGAR